MLFSIISHRFDLFDKLTSGVPVIILEDGKPLLDRMRKERIKADDILESARRNQGLETLDQIKCAVLERDGRINVIPK